MDDRYQPSYWHNIPDPILRDKRISSGGIRLYLEISGLLKARGYCWASNEYLAELMGVSVATVSRLVKHLETLGYIRTEMAVNDNRTGWCRRIYAVSDPAPEAPEEPAEEPAGGSAQKCGDPSGGSNQKCGDRSPQKCGPNKTSSKQDNTPLNPPKGGPRKRAKPEQPEPDWTPERFERFWQVYPRDYRGNKQKARRAWNKLRGNEGELRAMASALKRCMKSERWREGIGIPNASTFINPDNGYWDLTEPMPMEAAVPARARCETVVESRYEKL